MVTPVSGHLPVAPALEPASSAPLGSVGAGLALPSTPAEEPTSAGSEDPANEFLLAAAFYGGAPETSDVTLASLLNELGNDGV